jgi:hypothetical protein
MIARARKLLRRPKQLVRTLVYPLQRRLPISLASDPERRAIMVFDASTNYGGWMDRVKGMLSVYELARLTDRKLSVFAGETFPLAGLVEPATFDWRIDRAELRWHPLTTGFHVSRDRKVDAFAQLRDARSRTLFVETNLDYFARLHPELDEPARQALWRTRYHELFRLAPAFEREVAALADPQATAVHARFTTLLGDFRDITQRVLSPAERDELIAACLQRMRALLDSHPGRIVVVSDSVTFLRAVEALGPRIVTLPGQPAHLDLEHEARATLRKTLLDFNVMCRCARVVQLRLGPMYDSAFSRYAARVHDVPFAAST